MPLQAAGHNTGNALYFPLAEAVREIRLLEILPRNGVDKISCKLSTASLGPDLYYHALSYVLGKSGITEEILVNGDTMAVTTNLAAALRQLRDDPPEELATIPLSKRLLWADAICINQTDTRERSSQVALMGDIYRQVICMGEDPAV